MTAEERPSRTVEIISDTVGDTVTPAVTAAIATAAIVTRNPELGFLSVPIGAFTGALGKQSALLVIRTLRDPADRVRRLLEDVAEEAGEPYEDFLEEQVTSDPTRRLLGSVVAAATDATTDWKIRTLARAFVRGARDEARIDETLYFVARVASLDPPHARLLAAAAWQHARGSARMTTDSMLENDPGLGLAAPLLAEDLTERGFLSVVSDNRERIFRVTAVGIACAAWLAGLGDTISPPEPGDRSG